MCVCGHRTPSVSSSSTVSMGETAQMPVYSVAGKRHTLEELIHQKIYQTIAGRSKATGRDMFRVRARAKAGVEYLSSVCARRRRRETRCDRESAVSTRVLCSHALIDPLNALVVPPHRCWTGRTTGASTRSSFGSF